MDTMSTERHRPLLAGRYRLIAPLGSGGMGVVWRAFDELLGREVAAKEVRAPEQLGEADVRVLYARLMQEARAAARVSHPCVITVHDVVEQEGRPWIVMELVRGRSLADVLAQEGALSPQETARIGSAVLQALRSAHAAGVLHRDVKPANVLLESGGRVILTDFGIAQVEGAGTFTRTGDLIGSPDYLAPERALGRYPGTPSDLWSLGATLYAAVEGVSPFRRSSALSTLQAVVQDVAPPPRRAGPLTPLLLGLLHKDPQQRMGSQEAQRLLDAVAAGRQPPGPGRAAADVAPTPTVPSPGPLPYGPPTPPTAAPPPAAVPPAMAYGPPTHPVPAPVPEPVRRPVAAPVRRRKLPWLAPLLALLLLGGGITAVVLSQDRGTPPASHGTGHPGGSSAPSAAPSRSPSPPAPSPTETPPGYPGSSATCGGGWVTTCGPG
ncbi:serine/threonine-protein kinase [Streptomyces orinoci]|uniref:non-specific serine/threonine protein kinase n=1 Tax=Streptomyces orinoci TaxID=67339 RepID=A0ABV3JV37_STRON|nr:serine/threonine-protein kinase [Streptomyces orinoci]